MERKRWWSRLPRAMSWVLLHSLIVILAIFSLVSSASAAQPKKVPPRPGSGVTLETIPAEQMLLDYQGVVQRGQSSFVLLRRTGVSSVEVLRLQKSIRSVYNLQHLRVGRPYKITVTEDGRLHRFTYDLDTQRRLEVKRQGNLFSGQILPIVDAHKARPAVKTHHPITPSLILPSQNLSRTFPVHEAASSGKTTDDPATPAIAALPHTELSLSSHRGVVQRGQSSFILLRRAGVSSAEVLRLQKSIRSVYNLRHLRVGRPYKITVTKDGQLHRFTYDLDTQRRLEVKRQGNLFSGQILPIVYTHKPRIIQLTVRDSLHQVLAEQGETSKIAVDLVDIFAWEIDFNSDLRAGDTFKVMFDERYQDGKLVGYNRILAAEVFNRRRLFQALYYPPRDKGNNGDYFRPDGTSMRGMFLRSPLRYTRISSRFSHRRFNPILKRYKPHMGIDYAAPIGTPVRSVADGTVSWVGRKGPNGKMVKIRHNKIYTTHYLHLSRYARKMRVGQHVSQAQVIGYVGATGLATGPHLDFRITKRGKYLNPLQHKNIQAPPLSQKALPAFRLYAKQLLTELQFASSHTRSQ